MFPEGAAFPFTRNESCRRFAGLFTSISHPANFRGDFLTGQKLRGLLWGFVAGESRAGSNQHSALLGLKRARVQITPFYCFSLSFLRWLQYNHRLCSFGSFGFRAWATAAEKTSRQQMSWLWPVALHSLS